MCEPILGDFPPALPLRCRARARSELFRREFLGPVSTVPPGPHRRGESYFSTVRRSTPRIDEVSVRLFVFMFALSLGLVTPRPTPSRLTASFSGTRAMKRRT